MKNKWLWWSAKACFGVGVPLEHPKILVRIFQEKEGRATHYKKVNRILEVGFSSLILHPSSLHD